MKYSKKKKNLILEPVWFGILYLDPFHIRTCHINYLFTKSEIFQGKSQTGTIPYWPSDSSVNTARPVYEILL